MRNENTVNPWYCCDFNYSGGENNMDMAMIADGILKAITLAGVYAFIK
ncbi:hypothetical protein [Anaerovibrio lipolyticus]|nr:hypothetical protein [Anaerovibrio lipolyticus]